MAENKRDSSQAHRDFKKVADDYFNQPGAVEQNWNVPQGYDGEPLSPKGRELKAILEEERLWKEDSRWRAKNRLQDNLAWILDHQDDDEDAEYAYNTLIEIAQNVATYHNESGKKAERLVKILQDPTIIKE